MNKHIRSGRLTRILAFIVVCLSASNALGQGSSAPPTVIKVSVQACRTNVFVESFICDDRRTGTNTGAQSSIVDGDRTASVIATGNGESMQAQLSSRINYASINGPALIREASSNFQVSVYVKDTSSDTYSINASTSGRSVVSSVRPPTGGSFGCPCNSAAASADATQFTDVSLVGTASSLGGSVVTLPEYPGVNYRQAFSGNFGTSVRGTISNWDNDAGLFAEALLSVNIQATVFTPQIGVSPVLLDFAAVRRGTVSTKTFQITNQGTSGSSLQVSLSAPGDPFRIIGQTSFTLDGGESRTITVEFLPTAIRMSKAKIVVTSNDPDLSDRAIDVNLQGATEATFIFYARTFIPQNIPGYTIELPSLLVPPSFVGKTAISFPFFGSPFGGLTDQRGFDSAENIESRITLTGIYKVTGYNQFTLLADSARSDLSTMVFLLPVFRILTATATPYGKFGNTTMTMERQFRFGYAASGTDPFLPDGVLAIDYRGEVAMNFADGTISVNGLVDDFPAYEMYVRVVDQVTTIPPFILFTFPPIPPVGNLVGDATQPVSGLVRF